MPKSVSWSGSPSIKGSTEALRMAALTFSLIGLQFTWGIEMTYCTPYLLQLGLTKSKTSLVWIAGPLSGLIMQPVVGAISDRSTSKWGRRRPFMIGGAFVVAACLLLLGWTIEVVGLFVKAENTKKDVAIVVAVFSIYAVDFAINAVQSCCRSLIVDTLPIPQQQLGSAWASRMSAVGHLIGYGIGSIDMVALFGNFLGDTQFKKMCVVAASALVFTTSLTSWAVKERILISNGASEKSSPFSILVSLLHTTLHLPVRIQAICWVQFWSWIAWFPFLFYSSTWVGETYFRYDHHSPAGTAPSMLIRADDSATSDSRSNDTLGDVGRLGSHALVIFSIVTFLGSAGLPLLVRSPSQTSSQMSPRSSASERPYTPRPPPFLAKVLSFFSTTHYGESWKPELSFIWLSSHLLLALILIWTPWVRSFRAATAVVALCGIPWAVACWAPFTFMGVEINRLAEGSADGLPTTYSDGSYLPFTSTIHNESEVEMSPIGLPNQARPRPPSRVTSRQSHGRDVSDGVLRLMHVEDEEDTPSTGELAGVYLGVLNVYTVLPQFVGTFIAWVVFSVLEPRKNTAEGAESATSKGDHLSWLELKGDAPNAISICLFIGALCAIVAAEATRRFRLK